MHRVVTFEGNQKTFCEPYIENRCCKGTNESTVTIMPEELQIMCLLVYSYAKGTFHNALCQRKCKQYVYMSLLFSSDCASSPDLMASFKNTCTCRDWLDKSLERLCVGGGGGMSLGK